MIGGGILGCSTLYHLAKLGIEDVVLLERSQLSSGTTWHSAAQVRALRSSKNLTELIRYSFSFFSELEEETGVEGHDPVALAIHGDPNRDPRKHIIAMFYLVDVDPEAVPRGGDDAADAAWVPIADLAADQVAGSHIRIIEMLGE